MLQDIRSRFRQLNSNAPFWSLRMVDERSRYACVRQDVPEPLGIDPLKYL